MSRVLTTLGLGITLATLGGCAGGASDKNLQYSSDFSAMCSSGTHFTKAAAHTGPPPHPIVLLVQSNGNGSGSFIKESLSAPSTGTGSRSIQANNALIEAWSGIAANKVQVVACLERTGATETGQTCYFGATKSSARLFRATYELTVHEAATGLRLGEAVPLTPDNSTCPTAALVKKDSPEVYTTPSPEQYVAALRGYVER